jgi:hypothetical protein
VRPKIDIEEPSREKPLIDKEAPIHVQSRTDIEEPKRAIPKIDMDDPMRP